jgi:predicted small secreted protein
MRTSLIAPALALACLVTSGCDLFGKDDNQSGSPTSPTSPSVSLEGFAGTWSSAAASTPATGCGTVRYTVTPLSASSATVSFSATCAGSIQVNGTGNGQVNGTSLDWTAQGLVGQGGVNCPFAFTNGKAVEDPGGIKITYSGTVCGIPVSGSEVVRRS